MNIKKLANDYVECNNFEIKIVDNKIKIYYYDKIINFLNNKISIIKGNKLYDIRGKNLNINTMYEELLIISGDIDSISIGSIDDKLR